MRHRLELRPGRGRTRVRSAGWSSAWPSCGPEGSRWSSDDGPHPHEARYLKLDSSRARSRLGWRPPVDLADAVASIVEWYRALQQERDMRAVTIGQIETLQA